VGDLRADLWLPYMPITMWQQLPPVTPQSMGREGKRIGQIERHLLKMHATCFYTTDTEYGDMDTYKPDAEH